MKRIVSIAAAIFIALFISMLGLSTAEKIDKINKSRQTETESINIEIVTNEPSIWDIVESYKNNQIETTYPPENSDEINIDNNSEQSDINDIEPIEETTSNQRIKKLNPNISQETTLPPEYNNTPETRFTIVIN